MQSTFPFCCVQNKINHPLHVVLLALHAAVPVLLCHFQGDDGAAIVFFFMFLCMSLGGGVQLRYFILLGALVARVRARAVEICSQRIPDQALHIGL